MAYTLKEGEKITYLPYYNIWEINKIFILGTDPTPPMHPIQYILGRARSPRTLTNPSVDFAHRPFPVRPSTADRRRCKEAMHGEEAEMRAEFPIPVTHLTTYDLGREDGVSKCCW